MGQLKPYPTEMAYEPSAETQFLFALTGQTGDALYRAQLLWSAKTPAKDLVNEIRATAKLLQELAGGHCNPTRNVPATIKAAQRLKELTVELAAVDPKMASDYYIGGINQAANNVITLLTPAPKAKKEA